MTKSVAANDIILLLLSSCTIRYHNIIQLAARLVERMTGGAARRRARTTCRRRSLAATTRHNIRPRDGKDNRRRASPSSLSPSALKSVVGTLATARACVWVCVCARVYSRRVLPPPITDRLRPQSSNSSHVTSEINRLISRISTTRARQPAPLFCIIILLYRYCQ